MPTAVNRADIVIFNFQHFQHKTSQLTSSTNTLNGAEFMTIHKETTLTVSLNPDSSFSLQKSSNLLLLSFPQISLTPLHNMPR